MGNNSLNLRRFENGGNINAPLLPIKGIILLLPSRLYLGECMHANAGEGDFGNAQIYWTIKICALSELFRSTPDDTFRMSFNSGPGRPYLYSLTLGIV